MEESRACLCKVSAFSQFYINGIRKLYDDRYPMTYCWYFISVLLLKELSM